MLTLKNVFKNMKEIIREDRVLLKHQNIIIVGENCSGKSTLLKKLIKDDGTEYLIDSVNRKIVSNQKEIKETFSTLVLSEVVKIRKNKDYFNKKDIFSKLQGTELVTNELKQNLEKYQNLFYQVFRMSLIKVEVVTGTENGIEGVIEKGDQEFEDLTIDGVDLNSLSDGTQAKIRLLMEINYALENRCKTIYVDEFDIGFDTENTSENLKKIMNYYGRTNKFRLILTTHSPYAIRDLENFDIVKINMKYDEVDGNYCELFDGNDLDNLEIIDKKLFYRKRPLKGKEDIKLSNILKRKISGTLVEEDIRKLLELENLTLKQEVIKQFILRGK